MFKYFKISLITVFLMCLFVSQGFSSSTDTLYGFYNGLSDIIERNMSTPDACVDEADRFIQRNLPGLAQNVQKNIQKAETIDYENMSAEEAQEMANQVEQTLGMNQSALMNEGMAAMNRFTNLFTSFSMKYPEHADKINDSLDKVSEELGFY